MSGSLLSSASMVPVGVLVVACSLDLLVGAVGRACGEAVRPVTELVDALLLGVRAMRALLRPATPVQQRHPTQPCVAEPANPMLSRSTA